MTTIRNAVRLRAGLGFYCHAFNEDTLEDPAAYATTEEGLYQRLAELAEYARAQGIKYIGVEQMYSPAQIPWTLPGARRFLNKIWARSGCPIYLTLDTGHQSGQQKFFRLPNWRLQESLRQMRSTGQMPVGLWLGPSSAYTLFREAATASADREEEYLERIEREMDRYPYLFSM